MSNIAVNVRKLAGQPSGEGIPRYMNEIITRIGDQLDLITPPRRMVYGAPGNLWDQSVLPFLTKGRLLWSPNNTGPLGVSNQVVTIHDIMPLEHPEWFPPNYARLFRLIIPRLAKIAKRVIAVSEFSRERIIHSTGVSPDKVVAIPNGVDHSLFFPQPQSQIDRVLRKLDIPPGKYLLTYSAIDPRKNVAMLLQAWSRVQSALPGDCWLVVAGGQRKLGKATNLATALLPARVLLTGFVDDADLPALVSGALALVFPSLYEGFGLPVLEAMACGVPVVSSNRTALPEVVGDAGILVDPTSEQALADAIRAIVRDADLRMQMSHRSVRRAAQYSWDDTARKTYEVLRAATEM